LRDFVSLKIPPISPIHRQHDSTDTVLKKQVQWNVYVGKRPALIISFHKILHMLANMQCVGSHLY